MRLSPNTLPAQKRALGSTGLDIAPLVFGANVFGWTVDEPTSFSLLDRFTDAGFNAIDTADMYSTWVPGHHGGESERIIGSWLKANPSRRDQLVLITKVGADMGSAGRGLSANYIMQAVEASLCRLQTDYIDLYFSHFPDENTPEEETLRAYETLLHQGKIRAIGASNYSATQLHHAFQLANQHGLPSYQVIQPEYNLCQRKQFETELQELALQKQLGVITYFSLASGFLSGKYRNADELKQSARSRMLEKYFNDRGLRILDSLHQVAQTHAAQPAQVALAWIMAQKGVTAPIASATSLTQLNTLLGAAQLQLTTEDLNLLDQSSRN